MLGSMATAGLAGGMELALLGTAVLAAGPASFTVVERATTDAVTDLAASGDSAGAILTFANEVFDAADAEKVGSDNGFCVRTVPGGRGSAPGRSRSRTGRSRRRLRRRGSQVRWQP